MDVPGIIFDLCCAIGHCRISASRPSSCLQGSQLMTGMYMRKYVIKHKFGHQLRVGKVHGPEWLVLHVAIWIVLINFVVKHKKFRT